MRPVRAGRSVRDGRYDLETNLADIDALRQALGHERWSVGGHSAGAFYALAYALKFPDRVEAVIDLAGQEYD